MVLDDTAKGIIRHLQKDGTATNAAMAIRLGVSEETIRRRSRQMKREGVFQIVAIPAPEHLGLGVEATIGIEAIPAMVDEVAAALGKFEEVTQVISTAGSFSLLVSVVVKDNDALASVLKDDIGCVGGILKMETFLTLSVPKRVYSLPV